uniref:Uncharacterized protein n=1 Tax=Anguilla anguilla TaxID=7936 RepID=A0A0E9X6D3_ANGAN
MLVKCTSLSSLHAFAHMTCSLLEGSSLFKISSLRKNVLIYIYFVYMCRFHSCLHCVCDCCVEPQLSSIGLWLMVGLLD